MGWGREKELSTDVSRIIGKTTVTTFLNHFLINKKFVLMTGKSFNLNIRHYQRQSEH